MLQRGNVAAVAGVRGGLFEDIDIDNESTGRTEPYHIVMKCDRVGAHHVPDIVHDLVQVVSCRFRLGIRPQPLHDDRAVQPMSGCQGEQFHQRLRFAQTPAIFHGLAGNRDSETTQQRDVNLRCRGDLVHRRIFPRSD
jgi:hypothetical protein